MWATFCRPSGAIRLSRRLRGRLSAEAFELRGHEPVTGLQLEGGRLAADRLVPLADERRGLGGGVEVGGVAGGEAGRLGGPPVRLGAVLAGAGAEPGEVVERLRVVGLA